MTPSVSRTVARLWPALCTLLLLVCLPAMPQVGKKPPPHNPFSGLSLFGGGAMFNIIPVASPEIYEQLNVQNNLFGGLQWHFGNAFSSALYLSWYKAAPTVKGYTGDDTFLLEKLCIGVKTTYTLYSRGRFSYYLSAGVSLSGLTRNLPDEKGTVYDYGYIFIPAGINLRLFNHIGAFAEAGQSETGFVRGGIVVPVWKLR